MEARPRRPLEQWLREQASRQRLALIGVVGLGVFDTALLVTQAGLLAKVIDAVVVAGRGLSALELSLTVLLGVMVARAGVAGLRHFVAFTVGDRVTEAVRGQLYAQLMALGPAWSRKQRTGRLAETVVDGVDALAAYYTGYLPQMMLSALVPLVILAVVLPTDWVSALIMLITAPLIPIFMILVGRGAERASQRQWRRLTRMSAHFFDVIEGLTTLKLFNAARREARVVRRIATRYRYTTLSVLRVAFLSSLVLEFFATLGVAMIAVYVGFRLYYGDLAFWPGLFVLILAPDFFQPLRELGTQYHARMAAIGAAEQIVGWLDAAPAASAASAPTGFRFDGALNVRFENVVFGYRPDQPPVLRDISFAVNAGERVALVGPSGAGKTTLAQLMLGFLRPQGGGIMVNGVALDSLASADWLAHVAWLPQQPTLFYGSIADNIRLARADAGMTAVRDAARCAGADAFINRLPDSYATRLGDRGQGLSGGERQRIALARAFLADAPLVVLDEATARLDPDTEAGITAAIEVLARQRTMMVIAHRLETVRRADCILVLDGGRIVESGRHETLLARGGHYADLLALAPRQPVGD